MTVNEENKKTHYLKELQLASSPVKTGVSVIEQARLKAADDLSIWDLPSLRDEDWKQFPLKPLVRKHFAPAPVNSGIAHSDIEHALITEAASARIVIVNGYFSPELSNVDKLPTGCYAGPVSKAPINVVDQVNNFYGKVAQYGRDAFTAFNTAVTHDPVIVFVKKGVALENPIHILHVTDASDASVYTAPRVFIYAERHSDSTVIEDFIGKGEHAYFTTSVSESVLEDESHILHVKMQRETAEAVHISRVASKLGRGSNFNSYMISNGAKMFRNEPLSLVDAENAHATIDGLVLVDQDQISDTHSTLDHLKPNCTSHQLHKVIANGRGKSVFNGKIFVRKDSQLIDAFQENRNLLLSKDANVFTKPQLEIFADDVKCSHGATIGQLSDEEVFYMQSRGITKSEAIQLLTYGYALEVIENIPVPSLREQLSYNVAAFTGASIEAKDIV
ncbi:MAG: Fe-S cluster assembly protein SufD [Balneolales bacterium]|nr:Fe-S cluster assembly protein SufD [Balneolales bacterium]